jgi:hypothetical protein
VLIVENFLYLSKKTLSPCYNNVQISLYRSRMTTKTTIKPVYKEVPSCCSGILRLQQVAVQKVGYN